MTKSEYQELVEFLGERFAEVNHRFDRVDAKLEVMMEQQQDQIRLIAEAVSDLDRKLETFREQMEARFAEMMELFPASYRDLDRRITDLEARVRRLEAASSN